MLNKTKQKTLGYECSVRCGAEPQFHVVLSEHKNVLEPEAGRLCVRSARCGHLLSKEPQWNLALQTLLNSKLDYYFFRMEKGPAQQPRTHFRNKTKLGAPTASNKIKSERSFFKHLIRFFFVSFCFYLDRVWDLNRDGPD